MPSSKPPPNAKRTLFLLQGVYFFLFASTGMQVPHLAPTLATVGFTTAAIGSMWGLRAFVTTFSPTLWGILADKKSDARPFALFALLVGALSLFGLIVAKTVFSATLCFVLFGLSGTAVVALVDGLVLTALEQDCGDRSFGSVRWVGSLGFGLSALFSSEAVARGWLSQTPLQMMGIAGSFLLVAMLLLAFVPSIPREKMVNLRELKDAAMQKKLLPFWLFGVLHWASHGAYMAFLSPMAEAAGLENPERLVGLALAFSIVCEVTAMRMAQRILFRWSSFNVLIACTLVALFRWLLLSQVERELSFILLQGLHGITFGLLYCAAVDVVMHAVPRAVRQGAQGVFNSIFFGLGGGLGVFVAGRMLNTYGSSSTWMLMVGLSFTSLMVLVAGRRWMKHEFEEQNLSARRLRAELN